MKNVRMLQSETERMKCLASAPGLVFMLVASSDGDIDKKKLKRFLTLLSSKEYSILSALIDQAQTSITELLDDILDNTLDPYQELKLVCSILDIYLSENAALMYKATLVRLAENLTRDKSILDRFVTPKISDEQQTAINVVAGLLDLLQESQNSDERPAGVHFKNDSSVSNDRSIEAASEQHETVFPALKSARWAEYTKAGTLIKTIDVKASQDQLLPVIAYAVDVQDMVEFLTTEFLKDTMTVDQLHIQAMRNLEARLETQVEWAAVKFEMDDQSSENASGLVLQGDYYCSEAILSQKLLEQAHQLLDTDQLIAITPVRGELYVARLTDTKQSDPLCIAFAQHVIKRFFTSKQVQISPLVWVISKGRLSCLFPGVNALINQVKDSTIPAEQQQQQMVHVSKLYSNCLDAGMASNLEDNTIEVVVSS